MSTHCNTLQHTATHCNTLQYTATHCNTLQHTATHCNMQWVFVTLKVHAMMSSVLQHAAKRCNTLQHTATQNGSFSKHERVHAMIPQRMQQRKALSFLTRILTPDHDSDGICRYRVMFSRATLRVAWWQVAEETRCPSLEAHFPRMSPMCSGLFTREMTRKTRVIRRVCDDTCVCLCVGDETCVCLCVCDDTCVCLCVGDETCVCLCVCDKTCVCLCVCDETCGCLCVGDKTCVCLCVCRMSVPLHVCHMSETLLSYSSDISVVNCAIFIHSVDA